jgi:alpha-glucoside transport system substrate-binding protein
MAIDRVVTRRAVIGGALGVLAVPILSACAGGAASPTAAPAAKPAGAATTGAAGAAGTSVAGGAGTAAAGAGTAAAGAGTTVAGAATKPAAAGTTTAAGAGTATAGTPAAGAGTATAGTPAAGAGTTTAGTPAAGAGTATAGTPAAGAAAKPAGTPGAGVAKVSGTVSVLATWGGDEQANFLAMVKPFEDASGAKIQYEGTRDLNAILTTRVSGGNPPDVAGLPGPGQMAQFGRQGKLIDLAGVLDSGQMRQWYSDEWLKLGQADGKQVGIFIKSAVKGLIWYNTQAFQQGGHQVPKTWDEMMALSQKIAGTGVTPWAIGLESGAASGWPGTDWIEDIVLRQAGSEQYDQWHQGKVKWSSEPIKKAWQTWGQIVNDPKMTFGGKAAVLSTNFNDAAAPLFQSPPKAFLHHQANFLTASITKTFSSLKPGTDFDVFMFPDIGTSNAGAVEVAGDLFGMFKDTPAARELMKYLVTPDAQAIWVQKGGALSPNKAVAANAYPDPIARKSADLMNGAKLVRFDASDLMPEAMNNAFWKGILDFVNNPGNLDSILTNLDKVQADAYKA